MAEPSHHPGAAPIGADPSPTPGEPADRTADRPADHHPPTARAPEEYTETPGSHRDADGAATDVGG